jgi:hypothetical protein
MAVVEEFLQHYGAHDWDALAGVFSKKRFKRIGPYVDVIDGAYAYLDFLRRVVPTLQDNYRLLPVRIVYSGNAAVAELIERLEVDGVLTDIPEAIVFTLDDEGLIEEMHLYLQQPGGEPPVGGKDAMGHKEA